MVVSWEILQCEHCKASKNRNHLVKTFIKNVILIVECLFLIFVILCLVIDEKHLLYALRALAVSVYFQLDLRY